MSAFIFVLIRKPADVYKHVLMGPKHNFVQFKLLRCCLYIKSWSNSHHMHAGKRCKLIPSLPSPLDIFFRFQLSFCNGEVIQMWLARLMGSLGETSFINKLTRNCLVGQICPFIVGLGLPRQTDGRLYLLLICNM